MAPASTVGGCEAAASGTMRAASPPPPRSGPRGCSCGAGNRRLPRCEGTRPHDKGKGGVADKSRQGGRGPSGREVGEGQSTRQGEPQWERIKMGPREGPMRGGSGRTKRRAGGGRVAAAAGAGAPDGLAAAAERRGDGGASRPRANRRTPLATHLRQTEQPHTLGFQMRGEEPPRASFQGSRQAPCRWEGRDYSAASPAASTVQRGRPGRHGLAKDIMHKISTVPCRL